MHLNPWLYNFLILIRWINLISIQLRALCFIRKADFDVAMKPDIFVADEFEDGTVPFRHSWVAIGDDVQGVVQDAGNTTGISDEIVPELVGGGGFWSCPAFLEGHANVGILKWEVLL